MPPAKRSGEGEATSHDYFAEREADGKRCLEAALYYASLGWSVLACCPSDHMGIDRVIADHSKNCGDNKGKRPWHFWDELQERPATEREIHSWWKKVPFSNVGLALGPVSNLIRVDVDGDGGEEKLVAKSGGDLPPTLEFRSGRPDGKGRGLLYRIPPGVHLKTTVLPVNKKKTKKEELRFQAKGAQTVLPPSRHPEGGYYYWVEGHGPGEIEPALAPVWLVEELRAKPGTSPSRDSNGHRPAWASGLDGVVEGSRHDTSISLAGRLLYQLANLDDDSIRTVWACIKNWNEKCDPPQDEAELEHQFHDILIREKKHRKEIELAKVEELDLQARDDIKAPAPTNGDKPCWHLVVIGDDEPVYLLRSPYWSHLPKVQKTQGYISLTGEQVYNWSGKAGSRNNVRYQAFRQAGWTIPIHKKWNTADGLLGELMSRAEYRAAPEEMERSTYILSWIYRYLKTADKAEKGWPPTGKPTEDEEGNIFFKFEHLTEQVKIAHEDFSARELAMLLKDHAKQAWPDRRRWWRVEGAEVTSIGRITGQITND